MAKNYGFVITAAGWDLIARLIAGGVSLNINRVAFGKGTVPDGINPADLDSLIDYVANGSSTMALIKKKYNGETLVSESIEFVAEYRSNANGAQYITEGYWLTEFGVYAIDPDDNSEVMIYYGTLGDYPQYVTPYSYGAVDIRRFPISITLTSELSVDITYPELAFMTAEDTQNYAIITCKPLFLSLSQEQVDAHNVSPTAHPDIRGSLTSHDGRITVLERFLNGNTAETFRYDFDTLNGLALITGVWDVSNQRIRF